MSNIRRILMSQGGGSIPFCDADGMQICTSLDDDVRLRWSQLVKNGVFSEGGANWINSSSSAVYDDGIAKVTTSGGNNPGISTLIVRNGDTIVCSANIRSHTITSKTFFLTTTKNICTQLINNKLFENTNVDEFERFTSVFVNNIDALYLSIRNNTQAVKDITFDVKGAYIINLTTLFSYNQSLIPSSDDAFKAMFWSDGTEASKELGYTAYTEEPVELVVKNGKLWYAS